MTPLDLSLLFDLAHWFDGGPGFPSEYYYPVAALYLIGLAAGLFLYFAYARRKFREHRLKRRVSETASIWAIALALAGLLLLGLRFATVPYLSARVFLYVTIIASIGSLAYLVFYWYKLYPKRLTSYEARVLHARYASRPKGKSGGSSAKKRKAKKGK